MQSVTTTNHITSKHLASLQGKIVWSPVCAVQKLPLLLSLHTLAQCVLILRRTIRVHAFMTLYSRVSLTQRNASPGDSVLLERPDLLSGWTDMFLGDTRFSKWSPTDKNAKWPEATSFPQLLSPQTGFLTLGFINQLKENVRYSHQRIRACRRRRDWRQESITVYMAKPLR